MLRAYKSASSQVGIWPIHAALKEAFGKACKATQNKLSGLLYNAEEGRVGPGGHRRMYIRMLQRQCLASHPVDAIARQADCQRETAAHCTLDCRLET